jgi:hypothetical protein
MEDLAHFPPRYLPTSIEETVPILSDQRVN